MFKISICILICIFSLSVYILIFFFCSAYTIKLQNISVIPFTKLMVKDAPLSTL